MGLKEEEAKRDVDEPSVGAGVVVMVVAGVVAAVVAGVAPVMIAVVVAAVVPVVAVFCLLCPFSELTFGTDDSFATSRGTGGKIVCSGWRGSSVAALVEASGFSIGTWDVILA